MNSCNKHCGYVFKFHGDECPQCAVDKGLSNGAQQRPSPLCQHTLRAVRDALVQRKQQVSPSLSDVGLEVARLLVEDWIEKPKFEAPRPGLYEPIDAYGRRVAEEARKFYEKPR